MPTSDETGLPKQKSTRVLRKSGVSTSSTGAPTSRPRDPMAIVNDPDVRRIVHRGEVLVERPQARRLPPQRRERPVRIGGMNVSERRQLDELEAEDRPRTGR